MDGNPTVAELGLTPKDMGITQRPDATSISQAHSKILRFNTPDYFTGYDEIKGQEPPIVSSFQTPDGQQTIDLVGTQHAHQLPTQEKRDRMITRLDERFRGYMDATAADPSRRLIMIEGASATGVDNFSDRVVQQDHMLKNLLKQQNITTEQEAVAKIGEMGTMIFAAHREGIPVMSPEPSPEEIIAKQKSEGIDEADIALKQAILGLDVNVYRGQLRDQKRFTQDEVFTALKNACEQSGWQQDLVEQTKAKLTGNSETDQQEMKAFIDQVLPALNTRMQENQVGFNLVNPDYTWAFDPTNRDTYNHLHSPGSKVDVFKQMSNIAGEFRDDYILDQIVDAVSEGKSPFIVYGDGHMVKLKPAVAALYTSKETGKPHSQPTEQTTQEATREAPYRDVQFGRIYDKLEPHQLVNIAVLGNILLEIDEENLGLERISMENLQKGWDREGETFTKGLVEKGIDLDPFTVYKYYQIQRKVFQVLGKPTNNAGARDRRFRALGDHIKLSETKDHAMCSEYAMLTTYIAQKIGEPAHLIVGAAIGNDEDKWREAHAYVWVDGLNAVFDTVQAQNDMEYPALMIPTTPATTLQTLEGGLDIEGKRLGTNFTAHYGLEAGGFGVKLAHKAVETPLMEVKQS